MVGAVISSSLKEAGGLNQGKWTDLFRGIQFTNSYGATFYVANGLGAHSFTYIAIGSALQVVSCLFQIFTYDIIGRRFLAISGGRLCFIFLAFVSTLGVGSTSKPTTAPGAVGAIIASIILTQTFARWAVTNAFVIGGQVGGTKLRKKMLASAGVVNMCSAILVTSVTLCPVRTAPGSASLGAKVGWFFAAPKFLLFQFCMFIIPELKGRSLEETDELFDADLKWGWQFASYKTEDFGAVIAALQNEDIGRVWRLSSVARIDSVIKLPDTPNQHGEVAIEI